MNWESFHVFTAELNLSSATKLKITAVMDNPKKHDVKDFFFYPDRIDWQYETVSYVFRQN